MWDGGTARQNGLVDQFGDLDDALAWVAGKAGLEDGDWHAQYLGTGETEVQTLLRQLLIGGDDADAKAKGGDMFALTARREAETPARMARDLQRLVQAPGMRAYCLGCPEPAAAVRPLPGTSGNADWLAIMTRLFAE